MDVKIYNGIDEFKQMIVDSDPMKVFEERVREINWSVQKRQCKECGNFFEAEHPAKFYCNNCADIEDKINKRESVIDRINNKRIIRNCEKCGSGFILSAPAMKMCCECSPTGGQIIRD